MSFDPYKTLGVSQSASSNEIKIAYRELVKKHHPDTGGDQQTIISLNAAWEVLGNTEERLAYDRQNKAKDSLQKEAETRGVRNARASDAAKRAQGQSAATDDALLQWLNNVYAPIDRLLGQVINPFPEKLKELSADPYDDELMQRFCSYVEQSQSKLKKVEDIYRSIATPTEAYGFSLSLYHCLSQTQDAFNEVERYTAGYVDSYLHDGREMLREAKRKRSYLKQERLKLKIS